MSVSKSHYDFDMELAKKGCLVETISGQPVKILSFDVKDERYPILALVTISENKEISVKYDRYGISASRKLSISLKMKKVLKEGWVNIYMAGDRFITCQKIYETPFDADSAANSNRITKCKITWEQF